MMVEWANDGLVQANDGKMLINDDESEMLVNDGEILDDGVNHGIMSIRSAHHHQLPFHHH